MHTVTGDTRKETTVIGTGTDAIVIEAEIDEAGIEIDDDHVIGMTEEVIGTETVEEETAIEEIEMIDEAEEKKNAQEIDLEIVEGELFLEISA